MGRRRLRRELLSPGAFERDLEEEASLSREFDLPLTLIFVRSDEALDRGTIRRLLDTLRAADLVTLPNPSELAVALPNTAPEVARAIERRVRGVLPDARIGLAALKPDERPSGLLERARRAASAENP